MGWAPVRGGRALRKSGDVFYGVERNSLCNHAFAHLTAVS